MPNQYTNRWTAEEDDFLRENHKNMTMQQMADALGRTKSAVQSRCSIFGLQKVHIWTPDEDEFLRANYLQMKNRELYDALGLPPCLAPKISVCNRMRRLGLKRPKEIADKMQFETAFKKGQTAWNKGKYMRVSRRTEFKKGHLPANTKHDGVISIRVHKRTGIPYKYIRIALGKWERYHRYIWAQHHGTAPETHIVGFKNGDTLDCRIENLYCMSKAENALRNANHKKAMISMKECWQNPSDKQIAALMSFGNKKLRKKLLAQPELLEIKRLQLKLKRSIKNEQTDITSNAQQNDRTTL
ncbi:MAG: HNH endonuclease signature motif containing protein [bacterium]